MPFPLSSRTPSGPRRRTLLAAAAGTFALAGCSADEPSGDTTGGSRPSLADRARARAARDSTTLAGRYTAVIAAHPDLEKKLAPLRADVAGHARAFGAGSSAGASASPSAAASGTAPGSASGSPTPSPSGSASASASASASSDVAARPKDALSELATAELALADERTQALVELPGELARLLASVAAAGAAHAYLLTEAAK
ncbi:hypothetical protein [Streptomyces sp. NBC_00687]|uniref:hypothetical protein n=1 Tax=Streptomyces sp. NBC_00687 TaxID=2975807 RepID=UPI00225635EE|nr:hypothetical protein [Streptomyces sp. NBC_00687]MCX4917387.1 hypothetical protein [Streptomyces sp. NBC_00687]